MMSGFWIKLLLDGLFAAMAAVGFGAVSNPPLSALGAAALAGALGHALRFYLVNAAGVHIIPASFLGAIVVSLVAFRAARRLCCTLEAINFPALLPMVPGIPAYNTMFMLVKFLRCDDPAQAQLYLLAVFQNGFSALFILSALVTGMLIPMMLLQNKSHSMTRNRHF